MSCLPEGADLILASFFPEQSACWASVSLLRTRLGLQVMSAPSPCQGSSWSPLLCGSWGVTDSLLGLAFPQNLPTVGPPCQVLKPNPWVTLDSHQNPAPAGAATGAGPGVARASVGHRRAWHGVPTGVRPWQDCARPASLEAARPGASLDDSLAPVRTRSPGPVRALQAVPGELGRRPTALGVHGRPQVSQVGPSWARELGVHLCSSGTGVRVHGGPSWARHVLPALPQSHRLLRFPSSSDTPGIR